MNQNNPKLTPAQSVAMSAEPGKVTIVTNTGLGIIITPALARQLAANLTEMANVAEALAPVSSCLPAGARQETPAAGPWDLARLMIAAPHYGKKGTHLN